MKRQTRKNRIRKPDKVEIGFLEAVRKRCPADWQVVEALGDLYTRVGRLEEGLHADEQLARLRPGEPRVWYNLGCSYALTGQPDCAFEALRKAIEAGYRDFDWMKKDADLKSLRGDPRFAELFPKVSLKQP